MSIETKVEAIQWTGRNTGAVKAWMMNQFLSDAEPTSTIGIALFVKRRGSQMTETLFRNVIADPDPDVSAAIWVAPRGQYLGLLDGDWIAKGPTGFYRSTGRP